MEAGTVNALYDMDQGSYEPVFGSVELAKPEGEPKVFVLGGGGYGIPVYRALQRARIPFAVELLMENDIDLPVARALATEVYTAPAFEQAGEETVNACMEAMERIGKVWDAGCPAGAFNGFLQRMREKAEGLKPVHSIGEME